MATRGWLIYAGMMVVSAIVAWVIAASPSSSAVQRKADETWQLPQIQKTQSAKAIDILGRKSLWGRLPEVEAAKPLNDPEWRFMGFVAIGQERFLIIKIEGQPEQRLTVNDKLPGGSKILAIENDRVCLLVNGKKRSLGVTTASQRAL